MPTDRQSLESPAKDTAATAAHAEFRKAVTHYRAGAIGPAEILCKGIIKTHPQHADALHLLGVIALDAGHSGFAIDLIGRAAQIAPANASFHANLGNALSAAGHLDAAIASYDRALALRADLPEVHFYRANALHSLKRCEDAVKGFDQAIALAPVLDEAHFNRGNALMALGRSDEALQSYTSAATLRPDHLAAKKNIFWLHLAAGTEIAAVENLAREIAAAEAAAEARKLSATKTIPAFRVLHDLQQTSHLLDAGERFEALQATNACLREIHARHGGKTGDISVSQEEVAQINHFRHHTHRPVFISRTTGCLNPANDWATLEAQYLGSAPELVVIDDLLTAEALRYLQEFCLASTIWRSEYGNQYLGAFADSGFVSPLHLQIAAELREKLPGIFGGHAFEQLWGFKYDSQMGRGINVHADFARVNLNFWITPDAANLDPSSGGMIIYDIPAPASWSMSEYNNDTVQQRIYAFLENSNAGKRIVPYRCNRAVLFNSNLFHETDAIHFKEGYENRRINITYLFGRGLN